MAHSPHEELHLNLALGISLPRVRALLLSYQAISKYKTIIRFNSWYFSDLNHFFLNKKVMGQRLLRDREEDCKFRNIRILSSWDRSKNRFPHSLFRVLFCALTTNHYYFVSEFYNLMRRKQDPRKMKQSLLWSVLYQNGLL